MRPQSGHPHAGTMSTSGRSGTGKRSAARASHRNFSQSGAGSSAAARNTVRHAVPRACSAPVRAPSPSTTAASMRSRGTSVQPWGQSPSRVRARQAMHVATSRRARNFAVTQSEGNRRLGAHRQAPLRLELDGPLARTLRHDRGYSDSATAPHVRPICGRLVKIDNGAPSQPGSGRRRLRQFHPDRLSASAA
jgi:hypothetical protein